MSARVAATFGTDSASEVVEPVGGSTSVGVASRRAIRGGGFNTAAGAVRAGYRVSINPSSTGVPTSMDPYALIANGGLGELPNGGVRLACPAVIPVPATVQEGE